MQFITRRKQKFHEKIPLKKKLKAIHNKYRNALNQQYFNLTKALTSLYWKCIKITWIEITGNCKKLYRPLAFQGHQGNDQEAWSQLPSWSIMPVLKKYWPSREICHMHEGVVERGEDVCHAEHVLSFGNLRSKLNLDLFLLYLAFTRSHV